VVDHRSRSILGLAGVGSVAIALLQVVIYVGGPTVYRTFGAPPYIAELRGLEPVRMFFWSTFWFGLFMLFGLYAFSGAGLIRRLPGVLPCLLIIAAIYAVRSLAIAPQLLLLDQLPVTRPRDVGFSAFSLLLALGYAIGARGVRRSS
jgi:hypothetical protein